MHGVAGGMRVSCWAPVGGGVPEGAALRALGRQAPACSCQQLGKSIGLTLNLQYTGHFQTVHFTHPAGQAACPGGLTAVRFLASSLAKALALLSCACWETWQLVMLDAQGDLA